MSNRPRRRWLREQRLRAVAGAEPRIEAPPEEFIQAMADWNGWLRSAFRSIERPALRPDQNLPGEAGKLQNIQGWNKPSRFDLLNDQPDDWPESWKEIDSLDRLSGRYKEAMDLFYRARDGLEPMRRVVRSKFKWDLWEDDRDGWGSPIDDFGDECDTAAQYLREVTDFTAAIYRATRILRYNSLAIHQHANSYGHATHAARNVLLHGTVTRARDGKYLMAGEVLRYLNDKAVLPEAALLRVLALGAAARALEEFRRIAEGVVTHGDAIDLGDYEYAASHLEDAKTWCGEADRGESTIREEAGRIATAAVIEADARIAHAAQRKAIDLVSSRKEDEKKAESERMANIRKLRASSRSEALPAFISELRK